MIDFELACRELELSAANLRARMPEPGETIELGLAAGTPVVEIIRTAYTDDGHPVEVSEMIAGAGAYVFRYDFATT